MSKYQTSKQYDARWIKSLKPFWLTPSESNNFEFDVRTTRRTPTFRLLGPSLWPSTLISQHNRLFEMQMIELCLVEISGNIYCLSNIIYYNLYCISKLKFPESIVIWFNGLIKFQIHFRKHGNKICFDQIHIKPTYNRPLKDILLSHVTS